MPLTKAKGKGMGGPPSTFHGRSKPLARSGTDWAAEPSRVMCEARSATQPGGSRSRSQRVPPAKAAKTAPTDAARRLRVMRPVHR